MKHKEPAVIMKNNRFFSEKTRFGKIPYTMFFSEKLKKYYIQIETNILFDDGVWYSEREIKSMNKQDLDIPNLLAVHASKAVFNGAVFL